MLKMEEINSNTSGNKSFIKRFFGWFNMFRIVKYLNYVHNGLSKNSLFLAASRLLKLPATM